MIAVDTNILVYAHRPEVPEHPRARARVEELARMEAGEAARVPEYLAAERELQADLRAALGVPDDEARRNQRLLWTWDYLSLAICLDWAPGVARAVPAAHGEVDIAIEPPATGASRSTVALRRRPRRGPLRRPSPGGSLLRPGFPARCPRRGAVALPALGAGAQRRRARPALAATPGAGPEPHRRDRSPRRSPGLR